MRYVLLVVIALALAVPLVYADGHMINVLTVSTGNQSTGGIAQVYLDTRQGQGATFIDSFPLTQVDTQMSTRFAREYACMLADVACGTKDFFYVIRTSSSLVAGPSAGAAMTVLTYAVLENIPLDPNTVMTGTINSGGLIGPVGGTNQKILAARQAGFTRVLIPQDQYDPHYRVDGIEIIPVGDVEEAIWYFTGRDVRPAPLNISVPSEYTDQMAHVMDVLCTRANQIASTMQNVSNSTQERLLWASEKGALGRFYTAASYCFGANLDLRSEQFALYDQSELRRIYYQLDRDIELFDQSLSREFTTIADLEVFMIVRERLLDAHQVLLDLDENNISSTRLAYALERYTSAVTWNTFMGVVPSKKIDVSDDQLQRSCFTKLGEAEERLNYIRFIIQENLEGTQQETANAREYQRQEEWALCTFAASKAKAQADSVISALYGGDLNQSVSRKLGKAEQNIAQQSVQGSFPLLAYAYLEYAQDLENVYSANLYAEYAMEMAALDVYFPDRISRFRLDSERVFLLLAGIVMGFALGVLVVELMHRRPEPPKSSPAKKSSHPRAQKKQ